jgi:hypothetical protein
MTENLLRTSLRSTEVVGGDAHRLDELVRSSPEQAYDLDFFERFAREAGWRVGP